MLGFSGISCVAGGPGGGPGGPGGEAGGPQAPEADPHPAARPGAHALRRGGGAADLPAHGRGEDHGLPGPVLRRPRGLTR